MVVVVVMMVVIVAMMVMVVVMIVAMMVMIVAMMVMVVAVVAMVVVAMAMVPVTVVMAMVFEQSRSPGQHEAEDQGHGETQPIVLVELEFGEQVAASDADERAGTEGQRVGGQVVPLAESIKQEEQSHTEGDDQCEEQVDDHRLPARRRAGTHEGRDRQCIERLVEEDPEKRTETGEGDDGIDRFITEREGRDGGGGQCHAGDQGVDRHPEERSDPAQ